jgi:predicted protein tyrosine phosphatase
VTLIICGLSEVPNVIAARRPSHMITLLDAASMIETPAPLAPARHLKLGVNDIAAPAEGLIPPDEETVLKLLAFSRDWDETAPMLVHCWAGISRSTASALVIACDKSPEADERAMALAMRQAAPHAFPNRRIVALADDILGRRGRMVDAVDAMGGNEFVKYGVPFDFAARH